MNLLLNDELEKCGVYRILNKLDGRYYIGSTTMSFYKRMMHHFYSLRNNKHKNQYLQNAWNKYGEINFEFEIIKITSKEDTLKEEQVFIDQNKKLLYNINSLASGTPNLSKETIEKRRQTMLRKYRNGELDYVKEINRQKIPWNKGKKYESTDHFKVPKTITDKVMNKRKEHSENKRNTLPSIEVYKIEEFLGKWRSAKDLSEQSLIHPFGLSEFMDLKNPNGRNGYSAYYLSTFNINKACRLNTIYKGLTFKFIAKDSSPST